MRERDEQSRRNLEAGGLPLHAIDRLRAQASRQGTDAACWTSDLSVNEFLLTREENYVPLGQVMGSSIYHIGMQWRTQNWRNSSRSRIADGWSYELDVLTQAFYNARRLALNRLKQEAELLGATGVIGVQIQKREQEWGLGLLEFSAIGTAIRETHLGPLSDGAAKREVWLSELSGEEFWALRQGGFRPCGIAVGNCTYYQFPSLQTRNITQGGWFTSAGRQNAELPDYTQSTYTARELAMTRMQEEARQVGATGIVSVDIDFEIEAEDVHSASAAANTQANGTALTYHFSAIGTAIVPFTCDKPKFQVMMPIELGSSKPQQNEHIHLDNKAPDHTCYRDS